MGPETDHKPLSDKIINWLSDQSGFAMKTRKLLPQF